MRLIVFALSWSRSQGGRGRCAVSSDPGRDSAISSWEQDRFQSIGLAQISDSGDGSPGHESSGGAYGAAGAPGSRDREATDNLGKTLRSLWRTIGPVNVRSQLGGPIDARPSRNWRERDFRPVVAHWHAPDDRVHDPTTVVDLEDLLGDGGAAITQPSNRTGSVLGVVTGTP